MEHFILPRLSDGLGNRLFQYAVALGLSKKWSRPLRFAKTYIVPTNHGDYTDFLKLFPDVVIEDTIENPTFITNNEANLFEHIPFPEVAPHSHVVLIEYRHNPKYFSDIEINPIWNLPPLTHLDGAWMIHFRRGDYDKLPQYCIDLLRYYRRCLLAIPEGSRLHVFSDEPIRCIDYLEDVIDGKNFIVSWSKETNDIKALHEMSYCTGGAITGNSTFSWWGTYFAKQRSKGHFQSFYPRFWGQSLPSAISAVPKWGECVDV